VSGDGAYWAIEFEDGRQFKIAVAAATLHLEPSEPGTLKPKPPKTTMRTPCEHCGQSLGKSVYAANDTLRSCPKCSTRDGHEHVYYDNPAGFGEADAGARKPATGVKTHCRACRFQEPLKPRARCTDLQQATATSGAAQASV
jgi:hypothetical protein